MENGLKKDDAYFTFVADLATKLMFLITGKEWSVTFDIEYWDVRFRATCEGLYKIIPYEISTDPNMGLAAFLVLLFSVSNDAKWQLANKKYNILYKENGHADIGNTNDED